MSSWRINRAGHDFFLASIGDKRSKPSEPNYMLKKVGRVPKHQREAVCKCVVDSIDSCFFFPTKPLEKLSFRVDFRSCESNPTFVFPGQINHRFLQAKNPPGKHPSRERAETFIPSLQCRLSCDYSFTAFFSSNNKYLTFQLIV